MGRLVALVTAIALSCGACTSYKNSRDVAQLGGGIVLGTLIIGTAVADKNESIDAGEAASVMVPLILLGLGLGALGLVGMGVNKAVNPDDPQPIIVTQPPPQPRIDPMQAQAAELERRRRAAWDLTQQARVAAHGNDCPRVAYLAQRVIELDRGTFDTVFSRDPFIVKCAPQPPAPEQPRIPIPPLNPTIPPPQPPPAETPPEPTP